MFMHNFNNLNIAAPLAKKYHEMAISRISSLSPDIILLKENEILPEFREVAILSGYRSPRCSIKECAFSVFIATNETLNFWTHFIPTLYFMWQLVTFWDILRVISDTYVWPFAAYMITICLYPLISALAHTFYSVSDLARNIWFFLDYGSLSFYAYGSGLLYKAYAFPKELRDTLLNDIYLECLVFLTVMGTVSACYSRFMHSLFWIKVFRLGAFAVPWVWTSIPVIFRLIHSVDLEPIAAEHYLLQFFFSFLIAFFYASHLPERLAPGKFDFVGNSHQLLHISGIFATHEQMCGALIDMKVRRHEMLSNSNYIFDDFWAIHAFCFVFLSIASAIILFVWLAHSENCNKRKQ